jgi:zinc protease
LFTFYVGTDPRKVAEVRAALADEIALLAANGLTEVELNRAKKKLLGKQAIAYQSNASLAYTAALDELYGLGFLHYRAMSDALQKVTLEEVRDVANRYFRDRPAITVVLHPSHPQPPAELTLTEH